MCKNLNVVSNLKGLIVISYIIKPMKKVSETVLF